MQLSPSRELTNCIKSPTTGGSTWWRHNSFTYANVHSKAWNSGNKSVPRMDCDQFWGFWPCWSYVYLGSQNYHNQIVVKISRQIYSCCSWAVGDTFPRPDSFSMVTYILNPCRSIPGALPLQYFMLFGFGVFISTCANELWHHHVGPALACPCNRGG